jgi:two-component system response regulator GlrR
MASVLKSSNALLLDVDTVGRLTTALRPILDRHFSLSVHVQRDLPESGRWNHFDLTLDKMIERSKPRLVFLATNLLQQTRGLLQSVKQRLSDVPIILVIDAIEPAEVFELFKLGAADFVTPPLRTAEVLPRAWRLLRQLDGEQKPKLTQALKVELGLKQLIGTSPSFRAQVDKIPVIADCDANVLITGETGTGKEVYARAVHYCSSRSGKPFTPVNCGAIPVDLVENELFGHERGAFTGALTFQTGLVEEANGGTLFLDEIDCLPPLAQVKLLRFLQDKEYRPLGSATMRRADVRIVAATNLDLKEAVRSGKMRQDLYYRLNIISVNLPPLRERCEDIPLLAHHFLAKYSTEVGKETRKLSAAAFRKLELCSWPGNVRELEHAIERAVVFCDGPDVLESELDQIASNPGGEGLSLREAKTREIARFEKRHIQALLRASKGNITKAAQSAQKNRRAFWQLIRKYEIDVNKFKGTS